MTRRTICMINQKGGCGKSSMCFHLSGAFAQRGLSVLLIDADPQGSLSQGFFGSEQIEQLQPEETLAALFDEDCYSNPAESLACPTPFDNISIVRANTSLAQHNTPTPEATGMQQFAVRTLLDNVTAADIVLIDCPPNLYQCSWNALLASDFVAIPVPPEDFGTQGLRTVQQALTQARRLNQDLSLLGQIVTRRHKRWLVHRSYESKLRHVYGDRVLQTVVPEASAFKVALACRQPITIFGPRTAAAASINRLADEMLARMNGTPQRQVA